jgi:hypothetical protein
MNLENLMTMRQMRPSFTVSFRFVEHTTAAAAMQIFDIFYHSISAMVDKESADADDARHVLCMQLQTPHNSKLFDWRCLLYLNAL